jgi:hypothetical protein
MDIVMIVAKRHEVPGESYSPATPFYRLSYQCPAKWYRFTNCNLISSKCGVLNEVELIGTIANATHISADSQGEAVIINDTATKVVIKA